MLHLQGRARAGSTGRWGKRWRRWRRQRCQRTPQPMGRHCWQQGCVAETGPLQAAGCGLMLSSAAAAAHLPLLPLLLLLLPQLPPPLPPLPLLTFHCSRFSFRAISLGRPPVGGWGLDEVGQAVGRQGRADAGGSSGRTGQTAATTCLMRQPPSQAPPAPAPAPAATAAPTAELVVGEVNLDEVGVAGGKLGGDGAGEAAAVQVKLLFFNRRK